VRRKNKLKRSIVLEYMNLARGKVLKIFQHECNLSKVIFPEVHLKTSNHNTNWQEKIGIEGSLLNSY
jgi:hypothetical protein